MAETKPGIGHNSVGGIAQDRLKSFVERIENLEREKAERAEDIKDVYTEVKAVGFDTKIVRKVIARRKMDKSTRVEQDDLLETYERALEGILA